jgi:hypothetical protein
LTLVFAFKTGSQIVEPVALMTRYCLSVTIALDLRAMIDLVGLRLLIQITVFLEILISCFLGSKKVWFWQWTNQPGRTPRKHSPSGWRTEGTSGRLALGMPIVASTGLKG